jgi:large subunit ribosomal protein L17
MKHHDKNRKFGRERKVRTALLRSLARSLILEEKMVTTEAKAKSLRPLIERMVTHAKTDSVEKRRLISARLGNDDQATTKLFAEIAPRYKERAGGYVRIVKVGVREGDASVQAFIGFV